jgi:hypothetical protein
MGGDPVYPSIAMVLVVGRPNYSLYRLLFGKNTGGDWDFYDLKETPYPILDPSLEIAQGMVYITYRDEDGNLCLLKFPVSDPSGDSEVLRGDLLTFGTPGILFRQGIPYIFFIDGGLVPRILKLVDGEAVEIGSLSTPGYYQASEVKGDSISIYVGDIGISNLHKWLLGPNDELSYAGQISLDRGIEGLWIDRSEDNEFLFYRSGNELYLSDPSDGVHEDLLLSYDPVTAFGGGFVYQVNENSPGPWRPLRSKVIPDWSVPGSETPTLNLFFYYSISTESGEGKVVFKRWQDIPLIPAQFGGGPMEVRCISKLRFYEPFPNPARQRLNFLVAFPSDRIIRLKIYDRAGRLILKRMFKVKASGRSLLSLDLDGLPSGTYFYRLRDGKRSFMGKFLLLR